MENSIMIGRISSIDYKKGCADVSFPDKENMLKTELPFFSYEYHMPKVNEMVVVILRKYQNRDQGFILGPVFNAEYLPEFYGMGNYFKRFSEKAYMKYNSETETLEIKAPKIQLIQEE